MFCINLSNVHFISAKIDKTKKYIAVADSLLHPNTEIQKKLKFLAEKAGCKGPLNIISLKMPHQNNAVDCGVLSCLSVLFMAQNVITSESELKYETKSCALMMRLRIFSDLVKGKLTMLEQ